MFSMGQELSISLAWQFWLGGEAGRSVMRLQSRFQPGRQSSEDWIETGHFQAIHVESKLALSVGGGFNSFYVDLFLCCLSVLTIWLPPEQAVQGEEAGRCSPFYCLVLEVTQVPFCHNLCVKSESLSLAYLQIE